MTGSDRSHTNRARAESFGAVAEAYDRARPSYPSTVVDELMAGAPRDALDIGCGTGKLGRLLVARGVPVLGVEIDEQMAAIARSHGLQVEIGAFESWPAPARHFDLLVAAQAWHWIDPVAGIPKAADLLRAGGRLALLWNYPSLDEPARTVLDRAYARTAPELSRQSVIRGGGPATVPRYATQLEESGRFATVEQRHYPWTQQYGRDEWLALAATHSDHLVLGPPRLAGLLQALGEGIDSIGGTITANYVTEAVLAQLG